MDDFTASSNLDLERSHRQPDGLRIVALDRLGLSDREVFGGKAAFLGEMMSHGLRVPRGVASSVDAYKAALGKQGFRLVEEFWQLQAPDSMSKQESVSELASEIEQLLQIVPLDDLVAAVLTELQVLDIRGDLIVRSSASAEDSTRHSFAGQFESVRCSMDPTALAAAIRHVWGSTTQPHVKAYVDGINPSGRSSPILMAIVVQEHMTFDISGLLFTQHPTARVKGWMLVEFLDAAPQQIVMGEVTPNRCRINAVNGRSLFERYQSGSPLLSDSDMTVLVRYGSIMRDAIGQEADMEWGRHDGTIIALQCRPATVSPW